jgi:hypothetical protein
MPRRRPNPAYFIVTGIFLTMVALGAGMVIEDGAASQPEAANEPMLPTATTEPTATPEPTPEPTTVPEPTPEPDRTVCSQIAGTPYRSDSERDWYRVNCLVSRLDSAPLFHVPGSLFPV